jgi:glycosyltransferase involved in cell wall biosynthesis
MSLRKSQRQPVALDAHQTVVNPILRTVHERVSVILPAYNEEDTMVKSLAKLSGLLERLFPNYEIVVVDDGSTDNTRAEACRFRDVSIKVLGYENNVGKGNALLLGMTACDGDYVIFFDSDLDIDPSYLASFVTHLKDFDIVAASKKHPESQVTAPLIRKFLSAVFHRMVVIATGLTVSDTQTGFKAFRGEVLKKMIPLISVKKYAFDVELFTVASLLKLRVKELPVRISMKSGFSMRNVLRMFIDLLGITYRLRIRRWYQKNLNNARAKYDPILKW